MTIEIDCCAVGDVPNYKGNVSKWQFVRDAIERLSKLPEDQAVTLVVPDEIEIPLNGNLSPTFGSVIVYAARKFGFKVSYRYDKATRRVWLFRRGAR